MTFSQKLQRAISASESVLCIGLDPDMRKIPSAIKQQFNEPSEQIFEFCRRVIEATKLHSCAYKPNLAFFEALGFKGISVFERLLDEIPSGKIIIADAKRGDIGTTAEKYREAYFNYHRVDALTINPLMGMDTIEPFTDDEERALFVLAMTSNPGAADFLRLELKSGQNLGQKIAGNLKDLQNKSATHLGMVIGATHQTEAVPVMLAHPQSHLLIPGIGAQGGDINKLKDTLANHHGMPIISSSRAIIYAGGDANNWEELVHNSAARFKESLFSITKRYI